MHEFGGGEKATLKHRRVVVGDASDDVFENSEERDSPDELELHEDNMNDEEDVGDGSTQESEADYFVERAHSCNMVYKSSSEIRNRMSRFP